MELSPGTDPSKLLILWRKVNLLKPIEKRLLRVEGFKYVTDVKS